MDRTILPVLPSSGPLTPARTVRNLRRVPETTVSIRYLSVSYHTQATNTIVTLVLGPNLTSTHTTRSHPETSFMSSFYYSINLHYTYLSPTPSSFVSSLNRRKGTPWYRQLIYIPTSGSSPSVYGRDSSFVTVSGPNTRFVIGRHMYSPDSLYLYGFPSPTGSPTTLTSRPFLDRHGATLYTRPDPTRPCHPKRGRVLKTGPGFSTTTEVV